MKYVTLLSEFGCKGAKTGKSIYYINYGGGLRLCYPCFGSFRPLNVRTMTV